MRRDRELAAWANVDAWLMVRSKLKGLRTRSVKRACDLIVAEVLHQREAAPDRARDLLDSHHKHLLTSETLRRNYNRMEELRRRDATVGAFLARELARFGPWSKVGRNKSETLE